MKVHASLRIPGITLLAIALAACGNAGDNPAAKSPSAPPTAAAKARTEPLPADGGDVGKAYNELVAGYQHLDSSAVNRHVYSDDGTAQPVSKKDADDALPDMLVVHPAGGLIQGDRATLFLDGGPLHSESSASRIHGVWQFDVSNLSTWRDDTPAFDCTHVVFFPCKAATFPDAQVAGVAVVHRDAPNNLAMPGSSVLLDGYGVRMFDGQSKAFKYTLLVLSNVAPDPRHFARTAFLNFEQGTVLLEIAPDGKSAKAALANANHVEDYPRADVTQALTLDTSTPNRMRGHLAFDDKRMARIDVTFDIGTASQCMTDQRDCGNSD